MTPLKATSVSFERKLSLHGENFRVLVETSASSLRKLALIRWGEDAVCTSHSNQNDFCERVFKELSEYLEGTRKTFDLPIAAEGTPFQMRVWNELLKIPYGTTISYEELALRLGDKNLTRAVGLANGKNPIAVIVPCHRVIGKNGELTGYAGGLELKQALLMHEGVSLNSFRTSSAQQIQQSFNF